MSAIVPASTTRPAREHQHVRADLLDERELVRRNQHRRPCRRGVAREIADEPGVERIEPRERFVEHQQAGIADECRGDLDLLLLSLRQLLDAAARRVRQVHAVEPAGHLGGGMRRRSTPSAWRGRSTCRGLFGADRARVPPAGSRSRARAFRPRRRRAASGPARFARAWSSRRRSGRRDRTHHRRRRRATRLPGPARRRAAWRPRTRAT